MSEQAHSPEREVSAEHLRAVLDQMVPYIKAGTLDSQLIKAPAGKFFLMESAGGMVIEKPFSKNEIVETFVSDVIFVRTSKLVANYARGDGIAINNDHLIIEAHTPLDRREGNFLKMVADYERTTFSFIDASETDTVES